MPAIMLCALEAISSFAIGSKICVTGKNEETDFKNNLAYKTKSHV